MNINKKFIACLLLSNCIKHYIYTSQLSRTEETVFTEVDRLSQVMVFEARAGTLTQNKLKDYLEHGVNINARCNGMTALMHAAVRGDLPAVKLLVENQALINLFDDTFGESALTYALFSEECVQYLLDHGANINLSNHAGLTPLLDALIHCSTGPKRYAAAIKLLIQRGANLDVQDIWGWTALMYAATAESFIRSEEKYDLSLIIIMLLQAGAHSDLKSYDEKRVVENMHIAYPRLSVGAITYDISHQSQSKFFNKTFLEINPALTANPAIQQALNEYRQRETEK